MCVTESNKALGLPPTIWGMGDAGQVRSGVGWFALAGRASPEFDAQPAKDRSPFLRG